MMALGSAALAMSSAPAVAQQQARFGGIALGLTAGTLGLGVEGSVKAADWLVLRANVSGYTYGTTKELEGISFDFKTSLMSAGLIADLHPFSGGFRISAGGRYHDMKLSGASTMSPVTIGNHAYRSTDIGKLSGTITGEKLAPYIGLGYDSAHYKDGAFSVSFDLGGLYLGEPKTALTTERSVAGLDADLRQEEAKINTKISAFGFYPVLQLAAKYRF